MTQAPNLPDLSSCRMSIMLDRLTWQHGYYRVEATLDPFGDLDYLEVYEASSGCTALTCANRESVHTLFEAYAGTTFKIAKRAAYKLWRKRVGELYQTLGYFPHDN